MTISVRYTEDENLMRDVVEVTQVIMLDIWCLKM